MNSNKASYWINTLALHPHEEGGWYSLVYRSPVLIPANALSASFGGARPAVTAIYFLLEENSFSAMHKIASDEIWHFYDGGRLIVYEIDRTGNMTEHYLGSNAAAGEAFQCVVKAGSWFGARVVANGTFSLVGCTVAPGFDYAEFELANRENLLNQFPQHEAIIKSLTR